VRNNNLVLSEKLNYAVWNGQIIAPQSKVIQNGQYAAETRIQYYNYDNNGNLLEQSKTGDAHEVYIWGYNNQYPVAKVIGSDYNKVISFVNQQLLRYPPGDQPLRDELNKIRIGLADTAALVSTYTYAPKIGITSETGANGVTVYYEYDNLGRLKSMKDQNGKILKHYDYQYQKPVAQ
jgi:YD repeat-containing protein